MWQWTGLRLSKSGSTKTLLIGSTKTTFLLYASLIPGRGYWIIYRRPGFLAIVPLSPSHPSPVSKVDFRHTRRLRKRDNLLTGGRGGSGEGANSYRGEKSLVLYKSFNTLWVKVYPYTIYDKWNRFTTVLLRCTEIQWKTWCTGPYARVDCKVTFFPLQQSRLQYIYHGGQLKRDHCKRAILFLSSSKILTPHPPLCPASVYPPFVAGGGQTRRAERGMGGQYFGRREK